MGTTETNSTTGDEQKPDAADAASLEQASTQEATGQAPEATTAPQAATAEEADLEAREADLDARALGKPTEDAKPAEPAKAAAEKPEQQEPTGDEPAADEQEQAPQEDAPMPEESRWHPDARKALSDVRREAQKLRQRAKAAESSAKQYTEAADAAGLDPAKLPQVLRVFGQAVHGDKAAAETLQRLAIECGATAPQPTAPAINPSDLAELEEALRDMDEGRGNAALQRVRAALGATSNAATQPAAVPAARPAMQPAMRPVQPAAPAAPAADPLADVTAKISELDTQLAQRYPADHARIKQGILKALPVVRQQFVAEEGREPSPAEYVSLWRQARDRVLPASRTPAAPPAVRTRTTTTQPAPADDLAAREADLDRRAGVR